MNNKPIVPTIVEEAEKRWKSGEFGFLPVHVIAKFLEQLPAVRQESPERKRTLQLKTVVGETSKVYKIDVVSQSEPGKERILVFIKDPELLLLISRQIMWPDEDLKRVKAGLELLDHAELLLGK